MLFSDKKLNPREYNPLALAYIGDTVFDLYIRTRLLEKGNRHVADLHKSAIGYVSAVSQARIVHMIEDVLDEEEMGILKWGRNAKVNTHPGGASLAEYHLATGFETLVGFLYLAERPERLREILDMAYANFNEE